VTHSGELLGAALYFVHVHISSDIDLCVKALSERPQFHRARTHSRFVPPELFGQQLEIAMIVRHGAFDPIEPAEEHLRRPRR